MPEDAQPMDSRIDRAYNELMTKLFGVPPYPDTCSVERDRYEKVMHEVQERYGFTQGDPDFLEWVLTLVGRSPILTSEGKIVYGRHTPAAKHPAQSSMGEAPSGETE